MFFPWFIGNLVDDENGTKLYAIVSSWGIFYKGKLHKSHEVFASGFWDVVTFLVSIGCHLDLLIRLYTSLVLNLLSKSNATLIIRGNINLHMPLRLFLEQIRLSLFFQVFLQNLFDE